MSHEVLKVSTSQLGKMKEHYKSLLKPNTPQNAAFAAKVGSCTITAYNSGKVLFQGGAASAEASRWKSSGSTASKPAKAATGKKSVDEHDYSPPSQLVTRSLLGSDEAGTGDYFGPITVACTYLTPDQMKEVEHMGIRDSKTIKDPVIRELAPEIIKHSTYSLLTLSNAKYNELQAKGYNQGRMKAMMHHKAIENVLRKCREQGLDPEGVFVDQFCQPGVYFNYLRQSKMSWTSDKPIYFATKAESLHVSVAAASVIARYAFIREMDNLESELGLPVPKGASGKVDAAAAAVVRKYGREKLRMCTKLHFANTGKAERLV
ncbi:MULTISPECIES: ribonuclease HIII [Alteribacter]|uniref:Ribonuclease HIII n=1 Tax=Alteribacter keqinensis TaxID=2483800 RepID=A0A3M7TXE8_9BACI|nr:MULTISPECIES: ribonuclease HIII [Alteribacter]MBM7096513.1 ribonuclease HIII [Alteribacter salitolerans]RNA70278.1 ribonuclease HIII [Alteribacter keqinensis]